MSKARSAILSKIRASMGVSGNGTGQETDHETGRRAAVEQRIADAPQGVIPARGQLPPRERVDLFAAMAVTFNASVARVSTYQGVAGEVAGYLRARNLPASIRMGADDRLKDAGWASEKTLEILPGASDGSDLAGVSHAIAGIAETGTLALASGPDNPTTINFLPEHHIVVVKAEDIAGDMESVWAALRQRVGKGQMPRALNLVTGPSRSGDIEQKILLGAHGPRALHIIIVE